LRPRTGVLGFVDRRWMLSWSELLLLEADACFLNKVALVSLCAVEDLCFLSSPGLLWWHGGEVRRGSGEALLADHGGRWSRCRLSSSASRASFEP
jgi:hypothetical protein